jgi:hypothetical protein
MAQQKVHLPSLVAHRSCGWRAGCWSWSYVEIVQSRGTEPQERLTQGTARHRHRNSVEKPRNLDVPNTTGSR